MSRGLKAHRERTCSRAPSVIIGPQWFLLPQPQEKGQAESSGAPFRWDQSLSKTPEFSPATMNNRTCVKQYDLLLWGTLGKEAPSRSQLREANPNDFTSKGEDVHSVSWELEVLVCSSEVERLPSVREALSAILNMQNVNVRIVQLVLSQNKPNEPNMK